MTGIALGQFVMVFLKEDKNATPTLGPARTNAMELFAINSLVQYRQMITTAAGVPVMKMVNKIVGATIAFSDVSNTVEGTTTVQN